MFILSCWFGVGLSLYMASACFGAKFDLGTKIPHAPWPKAQNTEQKQCYNKFNKDLKNGLYIYI